MRGLKKKLIPAKFNETIGLQHCKLYVFDDSVIVSGANLSTDYFTNRQDRYVLIEDCEPLATFCEDFVRKLGQFSLELKNNGDFRVHGTHPFLGDYQEYVSQVKRDISSWLQSQKQQNRLCYDPSAKSFEQSRKGQDTWIFPSIQMGPFGINHDGELTTKFLRSGAQGSTFKFATGYFNLTRNYQNVIIGSSKASFESLCAHPSANGFLNARWPAGGIPHAYSLILRQFYNAVSQAGQQSRVSLHEYIRPGWTFHGKGLWYYLPGAKYPFATMVGSANFGYRSIEKDLEAQMTIVTCNEKLQKSLHEEQSHLFESSEAVTEKSLKERQIPLWVHCVVALFRKLF